jgi:hypothetical protein
MNNDYQEIASILFENKDKFSDNEYLKLFNLVNNLKNKNKEHIDELVKHIGKLNREIANLKSENNNVSFKFTIYK